MTEKTNNNGTNLTKKPNKNRNKKEKNMKKESN